MSRVLIVEDEEAIAEIEKDYLELSDFEVVIKSDGTQGLATALNEDCDIMILDVMLPGTDGYEICRQVREVKNTPIIMVSAKKEDIDKIRGLGVGSCHQFARTERLCHIIICAKSKPTDLINIIFLR